LRDAQFLSSLILIGILLYASVLHGLVYWRSKSMKADGIFSLLCLFIAAYASTNVVDLYLVNDISNYIYTSKLSSVFVILAVATFAWFTSEYLGDTNNIPVKMILILLTPLFIINLVMPYGILWSSIDGIELSTSSWGSRVRQPVNAVVHWLFYILLILIGFVYLVIIRASYISIAGVHRKRGGILLFAMIVLFIAFLFDMTIDLGLNESYMYLSEYLVLVFVIMMSVHLSNLLRLYANDMEQIIEEKTRELQRANEELEAFSYSVSHDLRAPLRSIEGFVKILKEDLDKKRTADLLDHMQRIIKNTNKMETMIVSLLSLAKVSRGDIAKHEIEVSELACEIIEELKEKESNRKVFVSIEEGIIVNGDKELIRILLDNLLRNAWKYTRNEKEASITLKSCLANDGRKGFIISDNGAGFDPDNARRLFSPFQRLHNNKEFPGIGIGLATVQRIVNRHNGEILAHGRVGKGASFTVYLNERSIKGGA